jgi:putative ABC transport system permease protein
MLLNYLKITFAVLMRRKFLTFVNLFGAALTLTVLVVAFALLDSFVNPPGAQHRQSQGRILTISDAMLLDWDAPLLQRGGPGFKLYEEYIATLETPDKTSFTIQPVQTSAYLDGRKVTSQLRRTDAAYWEILDFDLIEGRGLAADDIEGGRFVAVINEATANVWFPGESALGKSIVANNESYEVVGVVANEPVTSSLAYADLWVPLTTSATYRGAWIEARGQVMLYVEDPAKHDAVREELRQALEGFVYTENPAQEVRALAAARTPLQSFAAGNFGLRMPRYGDTEGMIASFSDDRVAELLAIAVAFGLLFMSLPAINMANLNIGRILERAPEIGLRKSAGASRRVLAGQFIFENVMLSALGGLVALAIAPILLGLLNDSLFAYGRLGLNGPVFVAAFAFVLVFGVLSGAYPAWKMARLEPAVALRGAQHV